MDIYSKKKRSELMSSVRTANTKPELAVRSLLHGLGYRFRLHRKDLPGKPDIVLPKHHAVVQVNGCFWHHHKECNKSKMPESNKVFWQQKIANTVKRDKLNKRLLRQLGWRTLTVWECETFKTKVLKRRLQRFIEGQGGPYDRCERHSRSGEHTIPNAS
jgi:DNA mismatch endonuclease (patch repair protein)